MCNLINTHTHTHIPPWEDQREWHRMTWMTRPDCAVMCNLINRHTNTHTHTHTSMIPPWGDQCEWQRITRMTGSDCAVMRNLINTHTHTHTQKESVGSVAANPDNLESNKEAGGGAQGAQGSSKICTSRESVSPLSRLIRGFRNKYH